MSEPHFRIVKKTEKGEVIFRLEEYRSHGGDKQWRKIGLPRKELAECEVQLVELIASRQPVTEKIISTFDKNGQLI